MSMVECGEHVPQTDQTNTDDQEDFQNTADDKTESKTTKPDKDATGSSCCQTSAQFSDVRHSNRPSEVLEASNGSQRTPIPEEPPAIEGQIWKTATLMELQKPTVRSWPKERTGKEATVQRRQNRESRLTKTVRKIHMGL